MRWVGLQKKMSVFVQVQGKIVRPKIDRVKNDQNFVDVVVEHPIFNIHSVMCPLDNSSTKHAQVKVTPNR